MNTTYTLFSIANVFILLNWIPLLFAPKSTLTQKLIHFPFIPLLLSFFYLFFLVSDGGLGDADFTSLDGILRLYHNATPEAAAAGWMHYLAFDYWVGCWMLRDAQMKEVPHLLIVLPLLCTFMLGPVGIMLYVFFSQARLAVIKCYIQP